jgi:GrpB-like predicted nucleotidyltransferase (UPF0157 family)
MPRKVAVDPHNPRWAEMFAAESTLVAQALGPNMVAVHHIGSTAIPTIHAKPIIDMLVEVSDLGAVDARNPAIEALGYEPRGEFGIPGRRFFRKDDQAGIRTHHIHAFAAGDPQVKRHLAFRDFLLANPHWARQYSELKRKLADANPDDIERYMDGKDAFIKEVDRMAKAWRTDSAV